MFRKFGILLAAVILCVAHSCAAEDPAALLDRMTLEEKVGQLFIIRPDSLDETLSTETIINSRAEGVSLLTDAMRDTYRRFPAGGFILFKKNLRDADQLTSFTEDLHALGSVALAIDEEGGRIARIANSGYFDVPKFPTMQEIAETGDTNGAYLAGNSIGSYLKRFGIDITFAPVADVNTNPDNPVIGSRAFGDDPQIAGDMVAAYLKGLHDAGTVGCVKHFPGHGDTQTDTHTGYAETLKTWDEMLNCEMIPFRKGIEAGTDMVMIAHIAAPAVTGDGTPATLSPVLITEKLRGELGYEGVIITDGMEMKSVSDIYTPAEAAIRTILAGADIVLLPMDYEAAFTGVVEAVNSGTLPVERLNESVLRILTMKERLGR